MWTSLIFLNFPSYASRSSVFLLIALLQKLSYFLVTILSSIVFLVASKGYSVLFMFLFADLLCCSAVFPVFYGLFDKNISKKLGLYSVISGLITGLALFPNQTFEKSILIGNILPAEYFPGWVSTALLFWSFVLATFVPMIVVFIFNKKNKTFKFKKLHIDLSFFLCNNFYDIGPHHFDFQRVLPRYIPIYFYNHMCKFQTNAGL